MAVFLCLAGVPLLVDGVQGAAFGAVDVKAPGPSGFGCPCASREEAALFVKTLASLKKRFCP